MRHVRTYLRVLTPWCQRCQGNASDTESRTCAAAQEWRADEEMIFLELHDVSLPDSVRNLKKGSGAALYAWVMAARVCHCFA